MSADQIPEINSFEVFLPVRLLDLDAGEVLDFDTHVFLPTNEKYIKISKAGESLDAEKIEKIRINKINKLYVSGDQIQKFYAYSALKLREIASSKKLTPAQRTERLISSVKELMTDLISPEGSKTNQEALKNCSEIISSYILQGPEPDWFIRVQETLVELGDQYSHSGNVSTLATLFSIGTCIGKPEELALAGLLHDLGKAQLMEIQGLDVEGMSPEQLVLYKKHPDLTLQLLIQKRIVISDNVSKTIKQHHEHFNGTGFPKGLSGSQICLEAQILSFADRFEELTKTKPGKRPLSPREAVTILKNEQAVDPSNCKYQPELLRDLFYLLPV